MQCPYTCQPKKPNTPIYLAGEESGQPAVDTEATEPVGDPMDELALELVPVPMPCRLSTPLRLMA